MIIEKGELMRLIKMVTVIGIALLLLGGTGVAAEKKVRWKLATTWGPTLSPFSDAVLKFADTVNKMSGGDFTIRVDFANKHKSPFGVFDMVKLGQYDMAHSASYYWKGKDIAFLPLTSMPFGLTASETYAWFYYGGGMALAEKAYGKHKMMSFPGGNTGVQMGGWFRKEIKSIDDLKGLKMRIPGFAGEVLAKLGLTVTNIAPGELYTSLERGTIDALEWVGPGMDIKMGFHKIAPYYYTGWHEPGSEMQFLVNKKKFEKLSEKNKEIVRVAMRLVAYDMYAENYYMSAEAWDKMIKENPNMKIKTFPKSVMDAMKAANTELLAEMKKKNPLFKEIIDSQAEFQRKARKWTEMSEYYYVKDNLVK